MLNFKRLILISAAVLPLSLPAYAADIIVAPPAEPVPAAQPVPQNTWSGGYIGGYVGGSKNDFRFNTPDEILKDNNFKYGAFAGWNFENDDIVYGVEGDAGYNNTKKASGVIGVQGGFDGSLRARLGYDMGMFMPYVTGGVAGAQVRYNAGGDVDKKFRVGWTAGAGVEALLTQNVSARFEYHYSDFGKKDLLIGQLAAPQTKYNSQDVRLGLAYKF
ncbi:outer membrane protein [Pseudochrobactrum sp. MP213Fo]|uniref:outer membrane protein n=1 Tax=Pseudochrobactrum sp. MP213Fo TaxID=3022250 RepID=UPI003BA0E01E